MKEILRGSNPPPPHKPGVAGKTVLKYDILILGGTLVGPWINLTRIIFGTLVGPWD